MAGHIQNVLRMYPLGISGSHSGVYLKCTQHLITGHIGVTCCLCSQCFHNVPSGYLGPCPQCHLHHLDPPRPLVGLDIVSLVGRRPLALDRAFDLFLRPQVAILADCLTRIHDLVRTFRLNPPRPPGLGGLAILSSSRV